jgi:hypothetical protein
MAYTILKSDGTTLCTIPDGTINTTSSSLGLPGRNYAGYGNVLDTNFVHIMESFADTTPPPNPLRGQLWFNISAGSGGNTLYVCPTDGEANASAWLALTSTTSGGAATFGSVTVTGNITANNLTASNVVTAASGVFTNISVSGNANIATGNITTAIIGTTNTAAITSGSATTAGAITGTWTISGGSSGNSLIVANGNVYTSGIRTDNYYYANGSPFNPSGTYGNANVAAYLPTYTGNLQPALVTTSAIAGGGTISGIWTLSSGARLNATYADLAERFEADTMYDPGTVVELGGDAEVTAVVQELSEDVFGVVSNTAAYLMNAGAGNDDTHPPIAVGGRVQVKVTGKVRKGQRLVSAGNGIARAAKAGEATSFNTIGRALAHKNDDSVGTVEAFVSIK